MKKLKLILVLLILLAASSAANAQHLERVFGPLSCPDRLASLERPGQLIADVVAKVCTKVANPTDTPGAGSYGSAQTVALADAAYTGAGLYICYTVDGSAPWFNGSVCGNGTHYTGTFSTGASTVTIKYIACGTNYSCSAVQSSTYTLPSCTTPSGSHVTESFGDSATLCWTAGPSSCSQTWTIGAGTAQSIITTPAGAPSNTACSNSLQMNVPGSNSFISLSFTALTSAFDVTGSFYMNTFSASGTRNTMICITDSFGCTSGHDLALISLDNFNVGSGTTVYGTSYSVGTNSTPVAVTAATWHTFDLHWDPTAANCSLAIDGGSASTFTCTVSGNPSQVVIGPAQFATGANTFEVTIGNVAW